MHLKSLVVFVALIGATNLDTVDASSQIAAGVIESVGKERYTYRVTYNWYLSGCGAGPDKCALEGKPQETRIINSSHCLLNGAFIARDRFLAALRVGLRHSMFSNRHHFEYPCIWTRDLDAVIGTLRSVSSDGIVVIVDRLNPGQEKCYPSCPLTTDERIGHGGTWRFVLDGKEVATTSDFPQDAWVTVYPSARPQTIEIRSAASSVSLPFREGEFTKADQSPYVHTAYGVITKVNDDGSYEIRGTRDGTLQNIAFSNRIKDGVTLNGFYVPASRAIRPGRWAAACCYRKRNFPNQLMVTDAGPGAVEGIVTSVHRNSVVVSIDERLGGGEKKVAIDRNAATLLDGKPSEGVLAGKGDWITVLPARGPSIVAETPIPTAQ